MIMHTSRCFQLYAFQLLPRSKEGLTLASLLDANSIDNFSQAWRYQTMAQMLKDLEASKVN